MYFTYRQLKSIAANALVVRTNIEPMSLAAPVRNAIWSVDKDQTVADIDTMDHIVAGAVARQRFSMLLLGLFAALALLLASIGIYGVMSYSVAQRTREIGIRIALGASSKAVTRLVVGDGVRLAVIGLVVGVGTAVAATRALSSLLYGVTAGDPTTFALIGGLVAVVALAASYLPARRAVRVDPVDALRAE